MTGNLSIGEAARRRRLELGYSQGQLAMKLNTSVALVKEWEEGDRSPTQDEIVALSHVLEADLKSRGRYVPEQVADRADIEPGSVDPTDLRPRTAVPVGSAKHWRSRLLLSLLLKVTMIVAVVVVMGYAVWIAVENRRVQRTFDHSIEMIDEGLLGAAVADFTEVIESEPRDVNMLARAYGNRSVALNRLGRYEEAVTDAATAIELDPPSRDTLAAAYNHRGYPLAALGRFDEAIADASTAIDLQPEVVILARSHYLRARLLVELDRPEQAVCDLHVVLELVEPTHELNDLATSRLEDLAFTNCAGSL